MYFAPNISFSNVDYESRPCGDSTSGKLGDLILSVKKLQAIFYTGLEVCLATIGQECCLSHIDIGVYKV